MATESVLWAAWARVAMGSRAPGVDGMTVEVYGRRLAQHLDELARLFRTGEYRPQPLRPLTLIREGKERNLALPTVRDRVAQRAFLEATSRKLDGQAAEASFAYRKGRSWLDALAIAERSRDQGLRHVLRADIEAFFDSIDHELLAAALEHVIVDRRAVSIALSWVISPVIGSNGLVRRRVGIPQGCPVSPALANAYLSGFDKAISGRRGRLVRYADDIAVFCSDWTSAEAARADVENALTQLRLRVNPTKTYVSSFDRGFSFLGWVFFGDSGYEETPNSRWTHPMTVARGRADHRASASASGDRATVAWR